MNYISMNTLSYFQAITKVRLVSLTSFLMVVSCLCSLHGCGQRGETLKTIPSTEIAKEVLVLRSELGRWDYDGKPFNGFSVRYHDNGQLSEKIGFYEGKKEGVAKKWYANGQLRSQLHYQSNKLHGDQETWWPSGEIPTTSTMVLGVVNGDQKNWYPSGQLSRVSRFTNGKQEGLQQAWRENGKLYANYEAKNGRVFGLKRSNSCYGLEDENVLY
jgi:hypothetical protein